MIASNLAKGFDLDTSVERAKKYISGALAAMLDLGKGSGPMDHGFAIKNEFTLSHDEITAEAAVFTNGESGVSAKQAASVTADSELSTVKPTPDKEAK